MATVAFDSGRTTVRPRFYVVMAGIFVVIAFGGFIPTYWAKIAAGTFDHPPIYHLHGLILFSWTLFYFFQTALVAAGRTVDHRQWGMLGIALATAIGFTVTMVAMTSIHVADVAGFGDSQRRFEAISFVGLFVFATFFVAAIVTVRRAEWHKRWMILAAIPVLQAAMARVFLAVLAPPATSIVGPAPPVFITIPPGLAIDLLVVAAMIYDWRTRRRVHPVYLFGLPFLLISQIAVVPIGASAAWMSAATAIEHLLG